MPQLVELSPILKWVGGKRQLLGDIQNLVPGQINTYYEPFVGGGAVFMHLRLPNVVINDYNAELINLYRVVRDFPDELIEELKEYRVKNTSDDYYAIRNIDRTEAFESWDYIQRAARTVYLNRTCFNGLYRVNSKGEFNVPYGKYVNPCILNEDAILELSQYLNENNVTIQNGDYKNVTINAVPGDFVYFDPPYMPVSETSSFTSYTSNGFGEQEQIDLKQECDRLNALGVNFLLSNSASPFILDLYSNYDITIVKAKRNINANGNGRGAVDEVLVHN